MLPDVCNTGWLMKKPVKKVKHQAVQDSVSERIKTGGSRKLYLLLGLSIVFYLNTCLNEYALDDHLVISKNAFTQQGLKGIPDLIRHTSYYGFFKNDLEEAALRYRPLVMITYALECELIKNKSLLLILSHLVNVLIFAGTVWVIFLLFSEYWFPRIPQLAFLSTLVFVIHPIHTESVANLKGRDELLSLFFALLALLYLFRHLRDGKQVSYMVSVLFLAAGLFSKESTVAFLAVIPLALYFFSGLTPAAILRKTLPFVLVTIVYIGIRFSITGWSHAPSDSVLNNPFLHAGAGEKYATITWCLGYYIRLLFFPHPLSYDYTYNQIRLVSFSNPWVLLSLLVHMLLLAAAVMGLKKKRVWSFGILFYFATILLVSNLVVSLGAFIGERLLYAPSLGFSMVMGLLFSRVSGIDQFSKLRLDRILLGFLVILAGYKTIIRNAVWKNNFTLMTTDVKASPESMKANDACSVNLILAADEPGLEKEKRDEYLNRAIYHDHKAAEIMPDFTDIYFNLGTSFSRLDNLDSTAFFWNVARKQKPDHVKFKELDPVLGSMYLRRALQRAVEKDMPGCLGDMKLSLQFDSLNAEAWYNYGGALFSVGRYPEAKTAFIRTLSVNPAHQQAAQGLQSLQGIQ